jgi:adenine-specific DNA-methyltransferase
MPWLEWHKRDEDIQRAGEAPYRLLQAVPEHDYGDPESPNMLIQGDNLDALKALLPYYAGQVKCIFIDPPYNTKSAFEHYDDNLEHSQWLAMMYPRLALLRELLAEDGSIWVTIDDNEAHYLKVIMDEVFGRKNFLTTFIWKKSYGGGAKAKYFVGMHEYMHCYAKNLDTFPDMFLPPDPEAVKKYYKFRDRNFATRGPYRVQPLATTSMDERPNLRYAILTPDGLEVWPEKQWQWSKERATQALRDDELVFVTKNGKTSVSYKQYLLSDDGEERKRKPKTIIDGHYTQHGTSESVDLFGQSDKFAFPKPEGLLQTVIESCTSPGDLMLDSFIGSGTSVAVAQKMGRRWIGIEMGEHAVTHCIPRLKKVVDGEQGGISKTAGWKGGGGFRFYRLGAAVFDAEGRINPEIRFAHLAAHVWFAETGTAMPSRRKNSALLGVHQGTAYYLLYNGILGDKTVNGGNVLTRPTLAALPAFDGPRVIYGEACRLSDDLRRVLGITFKQTPYDIKAR